jgi:hypothetical protein
MFFLKPPLNCFPSSNPWGAELLPFGFMVSIGLKREDPLRGSSTPSGKILELTSFPNAHGKNFGVRMEFLEFELLLFEDKEPLLVLLSL